MQETKQEFKVNKKAISFFEKLANSGRSINLEVNGNTGFTEIKLYDGKNLVSDLKLVRELGIHKLEKKAFVTSNSQYATGTTKNEKVGVFIFAAESTFEGCKMVEYNEEVTIPAKEAQDAIPEHKEIVKKKKIVCNGE